MRFLLRYAILRDYCALLNTLNLSASVLGFQRVTIMPIAEVILLRVLFYVCIIVDNFPLLLLVNIFVT